MQRARACLAAVLIVLALPASTVAQAPDAALEEVLVSGEQPGPGLWKVSSGDGHVLWILGTLSPLPPKMTWRSKQVEDVVAHADEIVTIASVKADVGMWTAMRLLPALLRLRKIPDGRTLVQVLPPELHARWLTQKAKYFGADKAEEKAGMEAWRPIFAVGALYERALKQAGLTDRRNVWPTVVSIAKAHDVKISSRQFVVPVEKPRELIDEFRNAPVEAEIPCFDTMLRRLEGDDLANMQQRAVAWATGDIAALRQLPPAARVADAGLPSNCMEAALGGARLRQTFDSVRTKVIEQWLGESGYALLRNRSTFTALPIFELLAGDGLLARLRASGYRVDEPDAR